MAEQENEIEGLENELELPPIEDDDPDTESEEEPEQEASEQDSDSDAGESSVSDDQAETDTETPPEEESGAEGQPEALEGVSLEALNTKLEELSRKLSDSEKANSGLYQDLKAERERRKQEASALGELRERLEAQHKAEQDAKAQSEIPDKEEDPVGYMDWRMKQLEEKITGHQKESKEQQEERAKREAFESATAAATADEQRFAQQHEDYYDALRFAAEDSLRVMKAAQPDKSEEEIQKQVVQAMQYSALQNVFMGKSPAEAVYEYAKRLGYKPQEAKPETKPEAKPEQKDEPAKETGEYTDLSTMTPSTTARGRKITMEEAVKLPDEKFDEIFHDRKRAFELDTQGYTYL